MRMPNHCEELFAPIIPLLEEFARQHELTFLFDTGEKERFGEPYCQVFWLNAHGCSCYLKVVRPEQDTFQFHTTCWGIHSKLGRKAWELVPVQLIKSVVPPLLQEVLHWSNTFRHEAEQPAV